MVPRQRQSSGSNLHNLRRRRRQRRRSQVSSTKFNGSFGRSLWLRLFWRAPKQARLRRRSSAGGAILKRARVYVCEWLKLGDPAQSAQGIRVFVCIRRALLCERVWARIGGDGGAAAAIRSLLFVAGNPSDNRGGESQPVAGNEQQQQQPPPRLAACERYADRRADEQTRAGVGALGAVAQTDRREVGRRCASTMQPSGRSGASSRRRSSSGSSSSLQAELGLLLLQQWRQHSGSSAGRRRARKRERQREQIIID